MNISAFKSSQRPRPFKNESGLSLVEVIVAMAVSASVMMIAAQMMNLTDTSITKAKHLGERDRLVKIFQKSLLDKANLLETAQKVPEVGSCWLPNDGRLCSGATSAASQIQIQYHSKEGGVVSNTGKLFGPNGEPGQSGGWRVNVWFYAACPNNEATCDEARTVFLRFQVKREPGSTVDPKVTSVPLDAEFDSRKSEFSVAHNVGGLLGLRKDQVCPANSFQVGMGNNGIVICQCRGPGAPLVGPDGSCALASLVCRSDPAAGIFEMMVGMERDGRPICARTRKRCGNISFDQTQGSENCPNAGWLMSITLGVCKAVPSGKKAGGARPIECSTNRGRCCWYELY